MGMGNTFGEGDPILQNAFQSVESGPGTSSQFYRMPFNL
jgi:hypothetical protein